MVSYTLYILQHNDRLIYFQIEILSSDIVPMFAGDSGIFLSFSLTIRLILPSTYIHIDINVNMQWV